MKIKIVVNAMEKAEDTGIWNRVTSEVWSGEMDIIKEGVYITKISVIAEGEAHPICDVPFSLTEGHWTWVPSTAEWPARTSDDAVMTYEVSENATEKDG